MKSVIIKNAKTTQIKINNYILYEVLDTSISVSNKSIFSSKYKHKIYEVIENLIRYQALGVCFLLWDDLKEKAIHNDKIFKEIKEEK